MQVDRINLGRREELARESPIVTRAEREAVGSIGHQAPNAPEVTGRGQAAGDHHEHPIG